MNTRRSAVLAATLASFAGFVGLEARAQEFTPPTKSNEAAPGPVCRTTQIFGITVQGTQGEKLGDLKDLVVDQESDCVAFAIVAAGGDKLLPVPFVMLQHVGRSDGGAITMATPDLDKAPSFQATSWPEFDRKYATHVYDYYKAKYYWTDAKDAKIGAATEADMASDDPEARATRSTQADSHAYVHAARAPTFRASLAIGRHIQDGHHERIGELFDVVLDSSSGRVVYAVVATGGFLGVGEKLMAVPWTALKPASPGEQVQERDALPHVLDATSQQFEKAPTFEKKSWPDMADRRWGAEIHRYWKQQPYWDVHADAHADAHAGASDVARHE